jgi:hypothetical protein
MGVHPRPSRVLHNSLMPLLPDCADCPLATCRALPTVVVWGRRKYTDGAAPLKELCNAYQPDSPSGRCIRFSHHGGPHQTFVSEWNEGEMTSRRRAPPLAKAKQQGAKQNRDRNRRPHTNFRP